MEVSTNADKPKRRRWLGPTAPRGSACAAPSTCSARGSALDLRGAILVAMVATRAKAKAAGGAKLSVDEAEAVNTFDAAMAKLEVLQQGDFEGIFQAMDGLPVVIRLIDPPLHEFLPNLEDQLVKVTRAEATGGASEEDRELLATIKSLHEQNPMLGLRGCRLGLLIPDFVKVQTRAILNALIAVQASGGHPKAKIMIPLVGHVNELKSTKDILEAEAKAVEAAAGTEAEYVFGTMIEVPRGALTADEIAQHADFFSFGTNDLTQMTFGYSRDDAEGSFLLKYVEDGILPANPFQTLDDAVVGLMKTAVDKGRAHAPTSSWASAASTAATPNRSTSANGSGSTTCRARRSASRWPGWRRPRPSWPARNATSSRRKRDVRGARGACPPRRWDPDERGIGVGDARAHLDRLDALRAAADQEGWVAEEPEAHLLPHIRRHFGAGGPWGLEATATEPDGKFVVELRWTGAADADRRTIRVAAYGLIGVIAEGITAVAEVPGPDGLAFEVVTGMLADQTGFASHGHTLRLRIDTRPRTETAAGVND